MATDRTVVRDVPVAARAVLRRHGRTFFFASHLLGSRHAARAATLYAFCRHVDNLADDGGDPSAARAALAVVSNALLSGHANDPWTAAMLSLQARIGLPAGPALDLVAGVTSDLEAVRMIDEAALIRYAYRVAGTVGLMMCAVLDVHDPRAHPFAIDLGIAMQLTNIARDVGEDARMDRRYLPASWVGDLPPMDIVAPGPALQRTLCDATRGLLARADRHYASAESGFGFLPARARLAILTAAHTYRAIGTRIAANGYRTWDQRAVVDTTAKVGHAATALLTFALSRRLHRRDALHDASLQIALARQGGTHG
ncbi:phytoene/squalene synthase family protein [Luteitalea sp.]|uniref:phytoene/squalene synthase family protein n=1 Tax=Luteitalea sp. TaxID=2004800 RepID=UPI0037CAE216